MRNSKGQFVKGFRASPETEFKKGEHWRERKDHWDYNWLFGEYVTNRRSALDIANQQSCTEGNILIWLRKYNIPRRDTKTIRKMKHWGSPGKENGMYRRTGERSSNWKGGTTPERQAFCNSEEWKTVSNLVWRRDKGKCQRCLDKGEHLHHIISFRVTELRSDINNLVLVCKICHHWIHSKKNIEKEYLG